MFIAPIPTKKATRSLDESYLKKRKAFLEVFNPSFPLTQLPTLAFLTRLFKESPNPFNPNLHRLHFPKGRFGFPSEKKGRKQQKSPRSSRTALYTNREIGIIDKR